MDNNIWIKINPASTFITKFWLQFYFKVKVAVQKIKQVLKYKFMRVPLHILRFNILFNHTCMLYSVATQYTSTYEWKFFDFDVKPQTNKQIYLPIHVRWIISTCTLLMSSCNIIMLICNSFMLICTFFMVSRNIKCKFEIIS